MHFIHFLSSVLLPPIPVFCCLLHLTPIVFYSKTFFVTLYVMAIVPFSFYFALFIMTTMCYCLGVGALRDTIKHAQQEVEVLRNRSSKAVSA